MSVTAVPLQPVKRGYVAWLWLGVLAAIVAALLLAWTGTRAAVALKGTDAEYLAWNAHQPGVKVTASGLQYRVLKEGEGSAPSDGDYVEMSYSGQLRDGSVFDASERPVPMQVGGAIPGFNEALKLMQPDSTYRFWIPGNLAYGAHSPDPNRIPNDAMLVFTVTVHRVVPAAVVQQMMMQQMMQRQQGGAPGGPGGPPPGAEPQQ